MKGKRRNRRTMAGLAAGLVIVTVAGATVVQAAPMGRSFGTQGAFGGQTPWSNSINIPVTDAGTGMNVTYASGTSEIATSTVSNTAAGLTADYENATTIVVSDDNSQVKITESGTYIVTGSSSDGNITVKKGTTGVVLVLSDLDLTSTTGATVSLNKGSEVKVIVEGTVRLTDAEDPANETSTDTAVADAFDGAALKAKDGSNVYLTGTGTLTIDASSCKNGIKVGDTDDPSFVIDGSDLTIDITAANDAINAGYDLTILSGTLNIAAGDDGIHADRILTLGAEDGSGPLINIVNSYEGLEGTVVNIFGGNTVINASEDAINAANGDGTYSNELAYSINITGGSVDIHSTGDGLDSNGNINLVGGNTTINNAAINGEAGIDYDGAFYVSDEVALSNTGGIMGPDGMGMPGDMGGQFGGMTGQPGEMGGMTGQPTEFGGMTGQPTEMGGMTGQPGGMTGMPGEMNMPQGNAPQTGQQGGMSEMNQGNAPQMGQQGGMPEMDQGAAPQMGQQGGMSEMNQGNAPQMNQQGSAPAMNQGNAPQMNQQGLAPAMDQGNALQMSRQGGMPEMDQGNEPQIMQMNDSQMNQGGPERR